MDLRKARQRTVDNNPVQILYGEFSIPLTDEEHTLFDIPADARVIDAYMDVVGGDVTAQLNTVAIMNGVTADVILAADVGAAAMVRMDTDGQAKESLGVTSRIVNTTSITSGGTISTTIRVMIVIMREDINV